MSNFNLLRQIDQLLLNWEVGISQLKTGWGTKCELPSTEDLISVLPAVLDDILSYQEEYNINMTNYDCNKIANFVAWQIIQKFGHKYATVSLFYGHFNFIDESIRSATLYNIRDLPLIANNLEKLHFNGEKLAPYCFLKGLDLTFTFCAGDGANC